MFVTLLVSILIYAALLYIISILKMPDPGPRVASIVVSIIFIVHVLNVFGVLHFLDR